MKNILLVAWMAVTCQSLPAQLLSHQKTYTHADTLRGSITPEREWWNVLHYDLHVQFHLTDSTISGYNIIQYQPVKEARRMQIDLMQPLMIDSIIQQGHKLKFQRDGNAYFVEGVSPGNNPKITVYYHGKPQKAKRPPWDGGVVWAKDAKGRPWITVACQGLGASVWYPCKDHQADEPDSATMHIEAPDSSVAVGNGRLKDKISHEVNGKKFTTYTWVVTSPINNYNLIPYIGRYVEARETYAGKKGSLDIAYWPLDYNQDKVASHLRPSVHKMLKSLEHWFGPYPFYEDGYKIVESPHLGMEHQSAIAYGNGYQNGYRGYDLSGSGWGTKWDFIVVHESAHEWFGNNITTKDLADMWVHESFANYSETLFTTSEFGIEAGNAYVIGTRKNIQNDIPIIGKYNVNEEGSGDMYYKGGNMLHMIRQIINDDNKFISILHGLNRDYYHQTVTTEQIEEYISEQSAHDFSKVFDQYLRTTQIPVLKYHITKGNDKKTRLFYMWTNCVLGFDMPVKVTLDHGRQVWLKPTMTYQSIEVEDNFKPAGIVDKNFYVEDLMKEPAAD